MAVPNADKRKLAEQVLNGLIIYAEEHAQEMWPPLFHIRKIVGEISAYWNLEKDWQRNFNSRLMLSYYDQKAEEISDDERLIVPHVGRTRDGTGESAGTPDGGLY